MWRFRAKRLLKRRTHSCTFSKLDNNTSSDFYTAFTLGDIIYLSILGPLVLAIIIGNLICLQVLRRVENLGPATKTFMASLAVSNLFFGLSGLSSQLLSVAHEFSWTLIQSSVFCYLNTFPGLYFTGTGSVSVLLLNFDAFVAIVKPLRYHVKLTSSRAALIIISTWLLSVVWSLVLFNILESSVEYLPKYRMCFLMIAHYSVPCSQSFRFHRCCVCQCWISMYNPHHLHQNLLHFKNTPSTTSSYWLNGSHLAKMKKRVLMTCPGHKIYRDEAVGLKSCKYTWKITIFVKMWNLDQNRENLIFC